MAPSHLTEMYLLDASTSDGRWAVLVLDASVVGAASLD